MNISFVIPAYNEELLLEECLQSVHQELLRLERNSSTGLRVNAEILVVNNASTDSTRDIAARFPGVVIVDEPKKGLVRARKAGFLVSTGELVANVDADTRMPAGWLSVVLSEFQSDEALAALSGPFIYYDLSFGSRVLVRIFYFFGYGINLFNQYVLRVGGMLQGGNFVVRRTMLEKVGGFDTSIEFYGEDTDIARRLSHVGGVKWTWKLPMYASGRRLLKEGIVTSGLRYGMNFFSTTFSGRPVTETYTDIRESQK